MNNGVKMLQIYTILRPNQIEEKVFREFLRNVSVERQMRVEKYLKAEDKIRSLLAEILLRYVLNIHNPVNLKELEFGYNEYGKPRIKNVEDLFFNLSHSGDWIICGIGNSNIGVDVEEHKRINFDIAERFYTREEYNLLIRTPKDDQLSMFYKLWTLKESYIKAVGKGLGIPLNSFSFKLCNNDIELYVNDIRCKEYCFTSLSLDPLHSMSICWQGNQEELLSVKVEQTSLKELIEFNQNNDLTSPQVILP